MQWSWQKVKNYFVPTKENQYRPCVWEGRFWLYCLIAVLIIKIAAFGFLFGFKQSLYFADVSKVALAEMANQERLSLGLNPLKENALLNRAAEMKAQDMLNKGYFSHQSPNGTPPWFWFKKSGYQYKVAGENLGIGFLDSQEIHQAWLDSPSHKANIINPYYQEIGIAVIEGKFQGSPVTVVVQLFGSAKKAKPAVAVVRAPSTISPKVDQILEIVTSSNAQSQVLSAATTAEPEKTAAVISEASDITLAEQPAASVPEAIITKQNAPIKFAVLKFLDSNYSALAQRLNLLTLLMIIAVASINILVAFRIQHRDLIIKSLIFTFLFIALLALNDQSLLALIPHGLKIN